MNMQDVIKEAGDSRILQGASVCPKENKDNDRSKSDMILVDKGIPLARFVRCH